MEIPPTKPPQMGDLGGLVAINCLDKLWKNCIIPSWWLNHPFEKYARQIGSFSQGSGQKEKMFETTT